MPSRLYFDIENVMRPEYLFRPYAGFKADLGACLGFGYKWESEDNAYYISQEKDKFEKDPYNDYEIIELSLELLHSADEIVSWYGSKHDLPYINTRAILLNKQYGNNNLKVCDRYTKATGHYDLCAVSKYRLSMSNNKLDTAAMSYGKTRKAKSNPAWWVDCMRGDWNSLQLLGEYCNYDVISLQDTHKPLMPIQGGSRRYDNDLRKCWTCGENKLKVHLHYHTVAGCPKTVLLCKACGSSKAFSTNQLKQKGIISE